MNDPLKPHEVVAHAALVVADPEAEMRKELVDMIESTVQQEVINTLYRMAENGELDALLQRTRQRVEIEDLQRHITYVERKLRTRL